jgi:hypothetical protein
MNGAMIEDSHKLYVERHMARYERDRRPDSGKCLSPRHGEHGEFVYFLSALCASVRALRFCGCIRNRRSRVGGRRVAQAQSSFRHRLVFFEGNELAPGSAVLKNLSPPAP